VELIREARKEEGSWVSLTFDPKGRIIIAREDKGLHRLTLAPRPGILTQIESINDTLHECRGLLWAYDSLYANANNDKGLYRLRDLDGDDQFEEVKLLRTSPGDVGHGRNDLVLGPDGLIYSIHGNDTRLPADFKPEGSPYQNYAVDRPIPCEWNQHLFNYGAGPPAGHVIRTDKDGKKWELVAGGFRNAFGIDFNSDGEMFTFDADMEWDVGLPWYRPCRVNHVVSGGDYGWRQGVNKWSAWYPDSLPSTLDIGLASPTAVRFGTKSHFPPSMKQALYILDWAYGRILAVHLMPQGASYSARFETILRGRPLNVTDLEFGPDGAMYFITGGRGTQSALYRVRYTGSDNVGAQPADEASAIGSGDVIAREERSRLEKYHGRIDPLAVVNAWEFLESEDPWLRHAARVAIEHQPPATWQERALSETSPVAGLEALLALARVGEPSIQPRLMKRLSVLHSAQLTTTQKLLLLRAAVVSCARHGKISVEAASELGSRVGGMLPDPSPEVNQLACELLACLESPELPGKAMALLGTAKTQEERVHYLYVLRSVKQGWTPEMRRAYFRALGEANQFDGAQYVAKVIDYIKQDALSNAPEGERAGLSPLLERKAAAEPIAASDRAFVRNWEMDDLEGSLELVGVGRDLGRGKAMFQAALCGRCHRIAGEGSTIGPDLSSVASRFGRRDLLEAILLPSKVIDDKYRASMLITTDGRTIVGAVSNSDADSILVASNPLFPEKLERVPKKEIDEQQASLVSPMPAGLLNTLSKEELLDLLAYLESASVKPSAASR
jgi:putative heme-binding domain-containing protein